MPRQAALVTCVSFFLQSLGLIVSIVFNKKMEMYFKVVFECVTQENEGM